MAGLRAGFWIEPEMTLDEAIARYVAIPDDRKALFLVRLSYELTVYMRGCYDQVDDELRATKLKGANEIQHHLASEAGHHFAGILNDILTMFSSASAQKRP